MCTPHLQGMRLGGHSHHPVPNLPHRPQPPSLTHYLKSLLPFIKAELPSRHSFFLTTQQKHLSIGLRQSFILQFNLKPSLQSSTQATREFRLSPWHLQHHRPSSLTSPSLVLEPVTLVQLPSPNFMLFLWRRLEQQLGAAFRLRSPMLIISPDHGGKTSKREADGDEGKRDTGMLPH
jgi:hypothetical protein